MSGNAIFLGQYRTTLNSQVLLSWGLLFLFFLWLLWSVAPNLLPQPSNFYDSKRLFQALILCLSCLCFYSKSFRSVIREYIGDAALVSLLGLAGLLLLDSFLSLHPLQSAMEALHYFLLFSVFSVGLYLSRLRLAEKLIVALLLCYVLLLLRALLFFSFELFIEGATRPSVFYPSVISVRFFNQIQVFFIPLLAIYVCRRSFSWPVAGLLFFSLLLAIAGGARGLLLSVIGAGVVGGLLFRFQRRTLVRAAMVLLAAFLCYELLGFALGVGGASGEPSPFRLSTSGRSVIWSELLGALTPAHLLLGSGTGAYTFTDFVRIEGHPHNSLLQFLFEWGLLATGIFVGLISAVFYIGWCFIREAQRGGEAVDLEVALFVTLLSAGLYSLFSGIVVMPIPQTLLFLYLGIFWARVSEPVKLGNDLRFPVFGKLVRALLVVVLAFYVSVVGDYYLKQDVATEFRGPRFWANGAPME